MAANLPDVFSLDVCSTWGSRLWATLGATLAVLLASLLGSAPAVAWEPPAELPYREVVEPPSGQPPIGAMLLIHGGGWIGGTEKAEAVRPDAERYAQQGWLVWNVDYRSSADAFGDVRMWYGMLADEVDLPICASGRSAGGHLALMLAVYEHVDCVISEGGPTDLTSLDSWLDQFLEPAFGEARWENSPLRLAREEPEVFAETQILLGHAEQDPLIPMGQVRDFAAALPERTELRVMGAGGGPFVHANVDSAELASYREAERRLLTRIAAPGSASVAEGELLVRAADGAASELVIDSSEPRSVLVSDPAGLRSGEGCAQLTATRVSCDADGVSHAAVWGGDRGDSITTAGSLRSSVAGEAGDDRLVAGLGPNDLSGGPGTDVLDYGARTAPLNLTLDGTANDGQGGEGDAIGDDVEFVVGGSAKDRMIGSSAAQGFWGQGGDDTLDGGAGNDWLNGGPGTDFLDYGVRTAPLSLSADGKANDGQSGEADMVGADFEFFIGGSGGDRLIGSPRAEAFFGQGGDDTIDGGAGGDWLNGGAGTDFLDYGSRTVPVSLSADGKTNDGEPGEADTVAGDFEFFIGGSGGDTLIGSSRAEAFFGQGGNDIVDGGLGRDWLNGGSGGDRIRSRDLVIDDVGCDQGDDELVGDLIDRLLGGCEQLNLL